MSQAITPGYTPSKKRKKLTWFRMQRHLTGYMFLLPSLLVFSLFSWYPIIRGFKLSFYQIDFVRIDQSKFVGWANFQSVIQDPLFITAWINVFYFVFLGILIGYLIPIILAIAINEMRIMRGFFRLAYYLPAILPVVAVIIMWKWFYDPGPGLGNVILNFLHVPKPAGGGLYQWYNNPQFAMLCLVIMATWKGAGSTCIIYLASLQGIPEELYEASEIDGAGIWRRIWHITLPQIRFVMVIILLLQLIGTFKVFEEPYIMTEGGPANATLTVMLLIYRYAFSYYDLGKSAALSVILFLVLVLLTIIFFLINRQIKRWT